MNVYDMAWKNIVKPTQIKSKRHLLGPAEMTVDNQVIVRTDLNVINRNNKKISGFVYHSPDI